MPKIPDRVLPDHPTHRPLDRFWPYAELSEQPTDEELAALHPELRQALFGTQGLPFSISIGFTEFTGDAYPRAVDLAKGSDEYVEVRSGGKTRHRARFFPGDRPLRLRDLYELVGGEPDTEIL